MGHPADVKIEILQRPEPSQPDVGGYETVMTIRLVWWGRLGSSTEPWLGGRRNPDIRGVLGY